MLDSQEDGTATPDSLQDDLTARPQIAAVAHVKRAIVSRTTGTVISALVCVLVAAYAAWYCSAGRFPAVPAVFNDYANLGDAFLHGQLALLETPNPELAALPNPYDFEQRQGLTYRWDASYYRGRYYLYWGPIPGLVSAALERIGGASPSGSLLLLIPYVGLLAVLFALLIRISQDFFAADLSLSVGLFILLGLLNLPMVFGLGQPRVYEASILYGQFFLLAGLAAWALFGHTHRLGWLVLAGLSWGSSVGCRYNLVISVIIFVALALVALARERGWRQSWRQSALMLTPMALCLLALGIYNALRFGNPFETGLSYQLTAPYPPSPYSISNVVSSFYIYLLYPLTTADKFPFIKSALFDPALLPVWLHIPVTRLFDHVTIGVLPSVPGLWLIALSIPAVLLRRTKTGQRLPLPRGPALDALPWMIVLAAAAQFLFILAYFYVAERYIADFYLSLILIIAMLTWKMDEKLRDRAWLRVALWSVVTALTAWSVGIGFFGGFGIPPKLFHANNPGLYAELSNYWDDRYALLAAILSKARAFLP